MRKALPAAVVTLSIVAAPVAQAHKPVARQTCGAKGARIALVTETLRVVYKEVPNSFDTSWYACMRASYSDRPHTREHGFKKRRFLGPDYCDPQDGCSTELAVNDERYRNPKVAFAWGSCSRYFPDMCGGTVRTLALRTGRKASTEYVSGSGPLPSYLGVTPTGTAVLMRSQSLDGLTLAGENLLFDSGPDLGEASLVGHRLFWMRGDAPQTATVP